MTDGVCNGAFIIPLHRFSYSVCTQLYRRWNTCFHLQSLILMHMNAKLNTIKWHYTEICLCVLQENRIRESQHVCGFEFKSTTGFQMKTQLS